MNFLAKMHSKGNKWKGLRLLILLLVNLIWVSVQYTSSSSELESEYKRRHITGFQYWAVSHFLPAFTDLGVFPLTVLSAKTHQINQQVVLDEIERVSLQGKPDSIVFVDHLPHEVLLNELGHTWRYGQFGRLVYLLPFEYLSQSAYANIQFSNVFWFLLASTFFIVFAFGRMGFVFTLLIICVIHLHPYYQFEIFENNNAFGTGIMLWLVSVGMGTLLLDRNKFRGFLLVFGGVFFLAFSVLIINIRSEYLPVALVPLLMAILFWDKKAILFSAALIFGTLFFSHQFQGWFEDKVAASNVFLEERGFQSYPGDKQGNHPLYHSLICGLSDTLPEAVWSDHYWYNEYLTKNPDLNLKLNGLIVEPMNQETPNVYYQKLDESPVYQEFVKSQFLDYIKGNSIDYVSHVVYRFWKNWLMVPPLLFFGGEVPFGIVALFVLVPFGVLQYRKDVKIVWQWALVCLSSLVLSISNILVYSNDNSQYGNVFHWFLIAYCLAQIVESLWRKKILQLK